VSHCLLGDAVEDDEARVALAGDLEAGVRRPCTSRRHSHDRHILLKVFDQFVRCSRESVGASTDVATAGRPPQPRDLRHHLTADARSIMLDGEHGDRRRTVSWRYERPAALITAIRTGRVAPTWSSSASTTLRACGFRRSGSK
jgi:hypothetical protein